jgi:lipoprotein signal peptidase
MSPISAMVFGVFGGAWILFAIFSKPDPIVAWSVIPIGIAGVIVWWAVKTQRRMPMQRDEDRARINKIVSAASIFEGLAAFGGVNVLDNLQRKDLYFPGLATIVGVHFLPFARFIPDRRYYVLAFALCAVGAIGWMINDQSIRTAVVCFSSAMLLWGAAVVALRELSRRLRQSVS